MRSLTLFLNPYIKSYPNSQKIYLRRKLKVKALISFSARVILYLPHELC